MNHVFHLLSPPYTTTIAVTTQMSPPPLPPLPPTSTATAATTAATVTNTTKCYHRRHRRHRCRRRHHHHRYRHRNQHHCHHRCDRHHHQVPPPSLSPGVRVPSWSPPHRTTTLPHQPTIPGSISQPVSFFVHIATEARCNLDCNRLAARSLASLHNLDSILCVEALTARAHTEFGPALQPRAELVPHKSASRKATPVSATS